MRNTVKYLLSGMFCGAVLYADCTSISIHEMLLGLKKDFELQNFSGAIARISDGENKCPKRPPESSLNAVFLKHKVAAYLGLGQSDRAKEAEDYFYTRLESVPHYQRGDGKTALEHLGELPEIWFQYFRHEEEVNSRVYLLQVLLKNLFLVQAWKDQQAENFQQEIESTVIRELKTLICNHSAAAAMATIRMGKSEKARRLMPSDIQFCSQAMRDYSQAMLILSSEGNVQAVEKLLIRSSMQGALVAQKELADFYLKTPQTNHLENAYTWLKIMKNLSQEEDLPPALPGLSRVDLEKAEETLGKLAEKLGASKQQEADQMASGIIPMIQRGLLDQEGEMQHPPGRKLTPVERGHYQTCLMNQKVLSDALAKYLRDQGEQLEIEGDIEQRRLIEAGYLSSVLDDPGQEGRSHYRSDISGSVYCLEHGPLNECVGEYKECVEARKNARRKGWSQ